MEQQETTDITLFVRTSGEDITRWNRQKIVEALIRETQTDTETAEDISRDVERQIVSSGITLLTTNLVREMVEAKLIERGIEKHRRIGAKIGFSLYDVRQLILHQNKENANVPHRPEGTNLVLAEGIKREYAFYDVFSRDVCDAHVLGDIHIHSLGYVDRPYNCCQSLEYIKKVGLDLPHAMTTARPAKHAEVLLAHMVRFSAILQGQFSGIISWDKVNTSFAPYLTGKTDKELRQFAQMMIYEFSQMTAARGGQAIFTDIHLHWEMPRYLRDLPALGPAGELTGKTYGDYSEESRRFAEAVFTVYRKGDATGSPFIFPRAFLHVTDDFLATPGHDDFLCRVCEVAVEKGSPFFFFEREENDAAMDCGSYKRPKSAEYCYPRSPWPARWATLQNVTLNLPRAAYKAQGRDEDLFRFLDEQMKLAGKAHLQKYLFIQTLLSYGTSGPLAVLTTSKDGEPYLNLEEAPCSIGILGMNELVQIHTGKQLHEGDEAIAMGLKVMVFLQDKAEILSRQHGLKIVLEQPPAETTAYRFAKLDLRYFSPAAGRIVKGDLAKGEIFYTNSTDLNVSAPVPPQGRIAKEGLFHPFYGGSAFSHVWLGKEGPTGEALMRLVMDAYHNSHSKIIAFSPEFTVCPSCRATFRGLHEVCGACGFLFVEHVARVSQYFSRKSDWNRGKVGEWKTRHRYSSSSFDDCCFAAGEWNGKEET